MLEPFVKRREPAAPGSIPDVLQMFVSEVRFYREIAPVIGVRVPACTHAEERDGATLLELENLAHWQEGAEPAEAAALLARMHRCWQGRTDRWPWLRPPLAGLDLVADLFDKTWPTVAVRADATPAVRSLGERLVGRVPVVEREAAQAGPLTLVHGDASMRNLRTAPDGEVALLDWEDVSVGPGVGDLAWLLVSSVDPDRWDEAIAGYGDATGLGAALPSAAVQAIFSLSDTAPGTPEAAEHVRRIEEAARRLA
jgi:hypothetical protein